MYLKTILSYSEVEEASYNTNSNISEKIHCFCILGPEYWGANIYNELTAEYLVWVQQTILWWRLFYIFKINHRPQAAEYLQLWQQLKSCQDHEIVKWKCICKVENLKIWKIMQLPFTPCCLTCDTEAGRSNCYFPPCIFPASWNIYARMGWECDVWVFSVYKMITKLMTSLMNIHTS